MKAVMSSPVPPILQLLRKDRRYTLEAYQFVREALDFAHRELGMGQKQPQEPGQEPPPEAHVSGQELCEAIRLYAWDQYGYLAKLVLNSWGICSTSDFGEIVYNLIEINEMKKSASDRREHFDNVYDFEEGFVRQFRIKPEPKR
jgi:uncharacterized repeat protein (TIGR04138 family)